MMTEHPFADDVDATHEPIVGRLRAMGHTPVPKATASAHLTTMAAGRPGAAECRKWRSKLAYAAAVAAAMFVPGTALAAAGALPGPAQDAAHEIASAVGAGEHVPAGKGKGKAKGGSDDDGAGNVARYQGPECALADGSQPKNHGQYVKAQPKDQREEASKSRCGKPLGADADGESTDPTTPPAANGNGKGNGDANKADPGAANGGKPADAGNGGAKGQSSNGGGSGTSDDLEGDAPDGDETDAPDDTSGRPDTKKGANRGGELDSESPESDAEPTSPDGEPVPTDDGSSNPLDGGSPSEGE